ncbi:hypothetical protein GCM10010924_49500 [Rhizobium wenxiniae]|nr:hypothetical protein GCM10010924_49500 [Rhizobium wenxiniae]
MVGHEPVIDRDHGDTYQSGENVTHPLVPLDVPQHPAAAMKEQQARLYFVSRAFPTRDPQG